MEMNYEDAIRYLEGLKVFGIRPGLTRIKKMLALTGHPEESYETVHVAGTNGKGSVSAMLSSILTRSGLKTGFYSSPHLVSYTERVRIDGHPIGRESFAETMEAMKMIADRMVHAEMEHPTQFEMLTALAFYAFHTAGAEIAVIETGLGGTLDSTNVITPLVSVITNVTWEHADRLGGTIESIAENKAGIIKEGVPVVTAAKGKPLEIIRRRAEELGADLFVYGEDFSAKCIGVDGRSQKIAFTSEVTGEKDAPYTVGLIGPYQTENAAVALMTAHLLHVEEPAVTEKTAREGLSLVSWPGRMEKMRYSGVDIVLDGAHNEAGVTALREALEALYPERGLVFLLGILKDKEVPAMMQDLLRPADKVVVTPPLSERADTIEDLSARARAVTDAVRAERDPEAALALALAVARREGRVLVICGSLYLIGAMRHLLLERMSRKDVAEEKG